MKSTAILARRPAALQVAYLGHSHSLFAPWIDYRVTDSCAEPPDWAAMPDFPPVWVRHPTVSH